MDPVKLAQQFVRINSVTEKSNVEIAALQAKTLEELGFEVEQHSYRDLHGLDKILLAARRLGKGSRPDLPGIGFACHNDVVSVAGWNCPHGGPFAAAIAEGRLWGRGACDMKGPTAAVLSAIADLPVAEQATGPIYFFVTGDEESGMAGARWLLDQSSFFQQAAAVGTPVFIPEPTDLRLVNAHKGGCHFTVSSSGVTAHSSTCDGLNANWQLIPFLNYLRSVMRRSVTEEQLRNWDFSPPTLSINVVIDNEPSAANITVGRANCHVFFRPMPNTQWRELLEEIKHTACDMELELSSIRVLNPVHTPRERPIVQSALRLLGQAEPISVCYATDGCAFEERVDVLVFGPGSIEQAHRHDEWIEIEQLKQSVELYGRLLRNGACETKGYRR